MFRMVLFFAVALFGVSACYSSDTPGGPGDAGVVDGGLIDGTIRRDMTVRIPRCGDAIVDPMESCDDGNLADGDGCNAMCRREAYCGDGRVDPGEACDDGDNISGGSGRCSADCRSNETCGNGIRDVAVGEACDDGNTRGEDACAADCRRVLTCGNGAIDPGETCDDRNTTPWDGCGADCLLERSLAVSLLQIGDETIGCDYSGDRAPDNAFGRALGRAARALLNDQLEAQIGGMRVSYLMTFLGLDDPSGASDPSLRIAWLNASRTTTPGQFTITPANFLPDGNARTAFDSRITTRVLVGGPEDMTIQVGGSVTIPLDLNQARLNATTTATSGELSGLMNGLLCGAVPVRSISPIPHPAALLAAGTGTSVPPPCDGSTDPGTLSDAIIAGATVLGLRIGGVAPDVDLDGNGLDSYEVLRTGPAGCLPVVTACIDGTGRRREGRGCASRMLDGFTAGFSIAAGPARIVGIR